ncbi:MAG: GPW/gp25 family protein [Pseudomonadota bacterium]|nr:GPW/gp25 family protein [Pseudomonadota bacterium]
MATIYLQDFTNTSTFFPIIAIDRNKVAAVPVGIERNPFQSVKPSEVGFSKFKFRDISSSFITHPLTGDLAVVTDFNAVSQAIKDIVLTTSTERHFDQINYGCGIERFLFNLDTAEFESDLKELIIGQIGAFEPRAVLDNVFIDSIPHDHQMVITIRFGIRTYDLKEDLKIFLQRA